MNWINNIKIEDLLVEAPYLKLLENNEHDDDFNIETLSRFMISGGPIMVGSSDGENSQGEDRRPSETLWKSVKKEMLEFICGQSENYNKLRSDLKGIGKQGSKVIIPAIAVYISTLIGAEAAMITGLISVITGVLIKTGKTGFCNFYYK